MWREENRRTRRKTFRARWEPTTNSTHMRRRVRESKPGYRGGTEASTYPISHPCHRFYARGWTYLVPKRIFLLFHLFQPEEPEKRQRTRKQYLNKYCRKYPYNRKPADKELMFIIVDDERKIIYCSVPKVASTLWKTILAKGRGLQKGVSVHRWTEWRRLHEYTEKERFIRLQTYFKFLFVREPLGRLLSAYKDKFIGINRIYSTRLRKRLVKQFRPKDFKKDGSNYVSFSEFVQYLSKNRPRDQHWRQYEQLCHPCAIKYDFIGRLETLEEDTALILKKAGIDDRVSVPSVHGTTNSTEVIQYYSQVPLRYITQLGEVYRRDFELFGYEYLGPVKSVLNEKRTNKTEMRASSS